MNNFPSKYKDDAKQSTGLLFIKTYNLWHRKIKKELKTIGLTHPQFVVLATLGYLEFNNKTSISQVMLANMSDIDAMTVSSIVRKLAEHDFIKRDEDTYDTRAKNIQLTPKGEQILQVAMPIVEQIDADFFGVINEQEINFRQNLINLIDGNLCNIG